MKIVVRQISGLGNQMFQYAAGRYYAEKYKAEMVLAIDPPRDAISYGFPRPFLLSSFAIQASCRELTRADRLLLLADNRRLQSVSTQIATALRLAMHTEVISEKITQRHCFLPDLPIHNTTTTAYLVGYWQVHQIADARADKLRKELTLIASPSGKNLELFRMIQNTPNSVSLHIRRGDYLLAQEGNVALSMNYYRHALEQLRKRIPDPVLFVFSDDIQFARDNLNPDASTVFVDHNDSFTAHEDLRLMSSCRHHIIANSSFSWWGAWLNPRSDKLVFAPRNWMVGQAAQYDDLFPPNWHLI